uniref:Phage protein n=1 Tax=Klebsiella phage PMBT63 TaxID=3229739 RepID=A0AB39C4F4_9CAUD
MSSLFAIASGIVLVLIIGFLLYVILLSLMV